VEEPSPSARDLAVLDFWIGRWLVRSREGGERAGIDVVERALSGYAVLEHWQAARGDEGKSLFYYDLSARNWKQVWVMQGFVKHKELAIAEPGRARFDGIAFAGDESIPDRTTLTALPDGSVTQLIEHSLDGGATWEPSFDAVYEPLA
jgi:hypothetical protein